MPGVKCALLPILSVPSSGIKYSHIVCNHHHYGAIFLFYIFFSHGTYLYPPNKQYVYGLLGVFVV